MLPFFFSLILFLHHCLEIKQKDILPWPLHIISRREGTSAIVSELYFFTPHQPFYPLLSFDSFPLCLSSHRLILPPVLKSNPPPFPTPLQYSPPYDCLSSRPIVLSLPLPCSPSLTYYPSPLLLPLVWTPLITCISLGT